MEIELEEDKKSKEEKIPLYVTAIFIAVSGIGFLIFTVYYIAFLPVPTPMYPLRIRVLTTLQLEKALQEDTDFVTIINSEDGLPVYVEPNKDSDVVAKLANAGFYTKVKSEDGWTKIQSEDGMTTGWVESEYIQE